MIAFIISTMCIHGPPSDQKSGMQRAASDVKFHPSAQQQMSLFHPSSHTPSLPVLALLLSLFLNPFLLHSHTEARRLERLRAYVRSGRDSLKESMRFWKSLRRVGLSMDLSFCLSLSQSFSAQTSASLLPHVTFSFSHFLSVCISLHVSLFQANVCILFAEVQRPH